MPYQFRLCVHLFLLLELTSFLVMAEDTNLYVSLISPLNNTRTTQGLQNFNCNLSYNTISNLTLYIWNSTNSLAYSNTTQLTGTSNQTSWQFTLPYDNSFKWNCLGYGIDGNYSFSGNNYTISLDTTNPTLQFVSPTTLSGYHAHNFIIVNVSASDPNLDSIIIELYDDFITLNSTSSRSSNLFLNFSGLDDGAYYTDAGANDSLGHLFWSGVNVIILDTITPSPSISQPLNNAQYLDGASITFSGLANGEANIDYYLWNSSIDGNLDASAGFSTDSLSIGTHAITFYLTDWAGHTGSASINVTILGTSSGNESNVTTNYDSLDVMINQSNNLSQGFVGILPVIFNNGTQPLVEFDYNFSIRSLDLSLVSINDTSNSTEGSIIIRGINLTNMGFTKTIYLRKMNSTANGICIKDAEITSISNISSDCSGTNEIKIECDGTSQSGYSCTYNSSSGFYKVTGLTNSGIKQIDYSQPAASSSSGGGRKKTKTITAAAITTQSVSVPLISSQSTAASTAEVTPNTEPTNQKDILFDIALNVNKKDIFSGDKLISTISLINFGIPGELKVQIYYKIINEKGEIVYQEEGIILVQTQNQFIKEFDVSKLEEGKYTLFSEIKYEGQTEPAQAEDVFYVKKTITQKTLQFTRYITFSSIILFIIYMLVIKERMYLMKSAKR